MAGKRLIGMVAGIMAVAFAVTAWSASLSVDQVLDGIEKRYSGKGFRADFFQESMLKAMQISDTAEGHLTVQRPDQMHWQYVMPDPQAIITDGKSLWVYRPEDNQVMVGKAPDFFGQGKGAGFLTDISRIRKGFTVRMQPAENKAYYRIQLIPRKPTAEISEIVISASKASFQIDQVVTFNAYGDETRIVLKNYQFNIDPPDSLFTFSIPEGVDVVHIDQP